MFAEALDRVPMTEWLTGSAGVFCPEAGSAAWKNIAPAHRAEILALAERYRQTPYPMRPASGFLDFVRTGSRSADEDPYFLRRRKLCAAALHSCLTDDALTDEVLDGIWCVCEETSWVISAHNVNPIPGAPAAADMPLPDPEKPYIDLFAAQTGMILSFVSRMLEKKLDAVSPVITGRITREIDRRILVPFMERDDFWWMGFRRKDLNNWTPWIISNVMVCAFLRGMEPEALARLLDRACRMLDRWLEVMPADGGCDEGAGYWNMAGGALLDCLEMLENASDGRFTFWHGEKLRNILSFPGRAEIGSGWFMNFADCDARPFLSGERLQLAGEKLEIPSLTAMGNRLRGTITDQLSDVPHLTRVMSLLFHPAAEGVPEAAAEQDVWLPDLQVRVVRKNGMTLCAKGGHNGENHNHNDVGSFMLYVDGEPEIVDAGNMRYTAKTFSEERYTLWNTRAAYHNVPLIGGREQQAGVSFRAREVESLPDGIRMDLAEAYDPAAGLRAFRREMRLGAEGLTIRDRIETAEPEEICQVFLFRNRPEQTGSGLATERLHLPLAEGWRVEIGEIPIVDTRMARSYPGSLWRVMITTEKRCLHELEWRFSPA